VVLVKVDPHAVDAPKPEIFCRKLPTLIVTSVDWAVPPPHCDPVSAVLPVSVGPLSVSDVSGFEVSAFAVSGVVESTLESAAAESAEAESTEESSLPESVTVASIDESARVSTTITASVGVSWTIVSAAWESGALSGTVVGESFALSTADRLSAGAESVAATESVFKVSAACESCVLVESTTASSEFVALPELPPHAAIVGKNPIRRK
jgi:hypothetical protein